jgi:hypothetical protein
MKPTPDGRRFAIRRAKVPFLVGVWDTKFEVGDGYEVWQRIGLFVGYERAADFVGRLSHPQTEERRTHRAPRRRRSLGAGGRAGSRERETLVVSGVSEASG